MLKIDLIENRPDESLQFTAFKLPQATALDEKIRDSSS